VNGDLWSQREILGDIADLIRRAPNDQARGQIAQAAFGRVGPELADALRGGSVALDRMFADPRKAGDVVDRDLIQRAEILDDRFDALTRRVGNFFKALAVGATGGGIETPLNTLTGLFGSIERAQAALGAVLFEALTRDLTAFDQAAGAVERKAVSADGLRAAVRALRCRESASGSWTGQPLSDIPRGRIHPQPRWRQPRACPTCSARSRRTSEDRHCDRRWRLRHPPLPQRHHRARWHPNHPDPQERSAMERGLPSRPGTQRNPARHAPLWQGVLEALDRIPCPQPDRGQDALAGSLEPVAFTCSTSRHSANASPRETLTARPPKSISASPS
jgi:hypothetical protein